MPNALPFLISLRNRVIQILAKGASIPPTALAALIIALASLVATPLLAQTAQHPLDALTWPEYWTAHDVLQSAGKINDKTRLPLIQLKEPPKEEVLAWKPGQPMSRAAFLVVRQEAQTFEAVVDLNSKKLVSWTEMKGVQPMEPDDEFHEVDAAVKADTGMQAAFKRRGITDLTSLFCGGYGTGYFGTKEEEGKRLLRIECAEGRGSMLGYGRQIEGLTALYDANTKKVIRVIDTDIVPIPADAGNYDEASVGPARAPAKPLRVDQPMGPSFHLDGQSVNWEKWNFHFRLDRRNGLIVTNVGYQDAAKLRSILYEGSLSEMFVPYMDPGENWFAKTFFDAGEFGLFSSSLDPGRDCAENAVYFDQVTADGKGMPLLHPRAACLFEQPTGYPAWRHDQANVIESRSMRELVLRTIGTFGNYDYIFDWIFEPNGTIRVRVGATGEDEVKGAKSRTATDDPGGKADEYGRFVAENTVAVDHDHFFSFRLDFDVDGTANSFVRDHLEQKRLPEGSLRKSLWVVKPEVAKTEDQAKVHMNMEQPEAWRVINPSVKNAFGYPVGYEVMGGENAMSLMVPEDYPQKRAGFTNYQIWVTPYHEDERYAAGDYPMQSKGGDGLPSWTKANRPIENTDIVLWYTIGFHHVPSAEDWPVLPTMWHEFDLKPVNFFSRSPAIDLPK